MEQPPLAAIPPIPISSPEQPKDWLAWRNLLPYICDPNATTQMRGRLRTASNLELFGILLIAGGLIVALVAWITNVEGSGIPLYLAIIILLLVAGVLLFLVATSMAHSAVNDARTAAAQYRPEFFMPDGTITDAAAAFFQAQGIAISS